MNLANRPSPWRTRFAKRAYASGAFWISGTVLGWITQAPDQAGWLRIRVDVTGLLLTAAALIGGANFFPAAVRALRPLRLDMNFLMGSAVVAAILIGEPFEAGALAFLFSSAELLERYAVDRSRRSITALLELAPEQAERIRAEGATEIVPASTLRAGDRIRVRPGDRIAVDGNVLAGSSAVNEAAITGESMPALKETGAAVFSGSLNIEGALDIEVTADPAHSVLARIVTLVRQAESRRAPIEHFVQRFARIYTPAVTVLAALVMILPPLLGAGPWLEWFVRGVTLLVIACPCALVIATPVTVVSALTSAAKHGVLIKGGEYLERLAGVKAAALDKTGTVTSGQLEVTGFVALPDSEATSTLRLIATAESRSEHPIAEAVVRYAEGRGIRPDATVESFQALPGKGIQATVDGIALTVGTELLVGNSEASRWGETPVGLAAIFLVTDKGMSARITLVDQVRPEAKQFVAALRELKLSPIVLLTGDHPGPAERVGAEIGVDEVRARLLPEQKVEAIRELRARYGSIVMLGDGVNDAPALAEASVSIAMGVAGSPAAIETADVALTADDLSRIPYAIRLARNARFTVRLNIAAALTLKLILAVAAVGGKVGLAIAVLVGDLGGSLLVTLNAMRLAHYHPPNEKRGTHRPASELTRARLSAWSR